MNLKALFAFSIVFITYVNGNKIRKNHNIGKIAHHIHEAFQKLEHNPNSTILAQIFPNKIEFIQKKAMKLKKCYSAMIGDKNVSIFKVPVGEVVKKYIKLHKHLIQGESFEVIINRMINLVNSIKSLVRTVLSCVNNEDPKHDPTQIGLTKFALMSKEEFTQIYVQPLPQLPELAPMGRVSGKKVQGQVPTDSYDDCYIEDKSASTLKLLPPTFDYRKQGIVTPVKDQGECNACYLFAGVAAIESAYMLAKKKKNVRLSEKDVYNCLAKLDYNQEPWVSGRVEHVFKVGIEHGLGREEKGDVYELDRVHHNKKPVLRSNKCQQPLSTKQLITKVKLFCTKRNLPADDYILKAMLIKYGPVTVTFKSSESDYWKMLMSKYNEFCNKDAVPSHALLLVGWDKTHWILKNSYGNYPGKERWGVNGYLYVKKTVAASCGMFGPGSFAMIPFVK